MSKVVVIHSGGLDSTVLLAKCKKEYDEVVALNFNYGSKHNARERRAAVEVCDALGIKQVQIDLPFVNELFKSDLLQSGGEIPQGHYEDVSMKRTVVPYRNSIMLAIAAGYAESIGAEYLAIGNHAGDHEIYPDCRSEYIGAMTGALFLGGFGQVKLIAPFVYMIKAQIAKLGKEIDAPMGLSYSCYEGREKHCGFCGTDVERIEAFKLNGFIDPADYEIEINWGQGEEGL